MNAIGNLLPLLLLAVAFYFLVIRRVQHQQRRARSVQQALAPGQAVVTTSGLYATVSSVEDHVVVLEVSPGVSCRYARGAVDRILSGSTTPDAGPDPVTGPDGTPPA